MNAQLQPSNLDKAREERRNGPDREASITASVERQLDDMNTVAQSIDDINANSEETHGSSHFARDLARVLMASDAAWQADAIRYFENLRRQVREHLHARTERKGA